MSMNTHRTDYRLPDRPETLLAQHFEEATGIHVEPDDLRKFMIENWRIVSFLAHQVRENDQRWKRSQSPLFSELPAIELPAIELPTGE